MSTVLAPPAAANRGEGGGPPVLLEGRHLARSYRVAGGPFRAPLTVRALADVSFALAAGRTMAVVGESGCGKSTLARLVTMIEEPTGGSLVIDGTDVTDLAPPGRRRLRGEVQIVFQNPFGSLNPRQRIGSILDEPLKINRPHLDGATRRRAADEMLQRVGLRPEHYDRYPHMFSGGQRQRIAIARALMLQPRILVLDEPVSALDLSVQAQVLNILSDLQDAFGLAYLFIAHDLAVVRHMADEVMVMYLGRVVETGTRDAIFDEPKHPYTRALLSATPVADPRRRHERIRIEGELPSPIDPPPGCPFHPRCPLAFERCRSDRPELEARGSTTVACWAVDATGRVTRTHRSIP